MAACFTFFFMMGLCLSLARFFTYNGCYLKSKQILEYHPQMLQEYLRGADQTSFMYPRLGHRPSIKYLHAFIFLRAQCL